ncbi:MAG TPA: hypothetical protein VHG93_23195 [Longimicrobium sp.]|nr:hypothetical protein [Longimicrobium sp.]
MHLTMPVLRGMVIACAAAGCMESGVGTPARGPNPAATSATLALDLRNPDAARETAFGDAVLFTAPGIGVALALDGGAEPGLQDGYVDQVFVLQQAAPTMFESRILRSAEVFFAGRVLMIRTAAGARTALMVQVDGEPVPLVDRLPFSSAGAERFTGFGMSRRTGAWGIGLDEVIGARMSDLLPACATNGEAGIASVCDSGGEGSTSCSTSCSIGSGSCSTSCGTGYYSCCSMTACSCTCVAGGGGGGGPKPPINVTSEPSGARRP